MDDEMSDAVLSQCSVRMQAWMVDVVERREEKRKRKRKKRRHGAGWCCRQEAVAQRLPGNGNDKGEDMARACGKIRESPGATAARDVVGGNAYRCRYDRSCFATGSE